MRREVGEETRRAKEGRPATFRAMSDGIVTYKQQSLEEIVEMVKGERSRSISTTESAISPSQSNTSLLTPASTLEHVDERPGKDKKGVRVSWRRRLLSFDGRRSKES